MIAAHKYLDLNLSILNLGGIILTIGKQSKIIKYDELLQIVIAERGESAKDVFIPTLSFLYILGKLDYRNEIDAIEFKK